nr:T9SS type A sorting domain-containing protein [Bacteroidota bacterium]
MKNYFISMLMLVAIFCNHNVHGANVSWNNVAGGNWSVGANWSNGSGPGANDTAVISLNGTYTVTMDMNVNCQKLVLGGNSGTQTLSASSFSLTIGKGATINPKGLLYLYGCTVTGNLAMVNNGQIQLVYANTFNINLVNNDTIEVWHYSNYINQNYTAASGSVILFNCKSYTTGLTFATGFNNSGKIVFNSVTGYNASLAITTGTLNNTASGVIEASGIYNLSYTISGIVTNAGNINVNNNLSFTSSSNLTNTGTITIANGYILSITNSTYTHTSGNVNGTGKFYFEGSTANFNVASMPGKYLEFYTTVINSTFLPITNAKKIRLIYGNTINCALFNTDTILIGHYGNVMSGALTTSPASRIIMDGASYSTQINISKSFTNNGKIIFASTTGYGCTFAVDSGPIINSGSGEILSAGVTTANYLYAAVNNLGTITATQSLTWQKADSSKTNGTINIAAAMTLNFAAGSLSVNGGSISGPGTLSFNGSTYIENLANMPSLPVIMSSAQLKSNAALINNYGNLQLIYGNTIYANLKNKNTGTIRLSHYANTMHGKFSNEAGSTLSLDGANYTTDITFDSAFVNNGNIDLRGVTGYGSTIIVSNGELTNNSTGTIHSFEYGPHYITASINNKGTMIIDLSCTLNKANGLHSNNSGASITIAASQPLTIQNARFDYNAGSITGAGALYFDNTVYNLAVANFPSVYHTFYNSKVEATGVVGNSTTLQFLYNDSIKASINNKATGVIRVSHYYNYMTGTFTNVAGSKITIDGANYTSDLYVLNGFTNKGTIELTSLTGYGSGLYIQNGVLTNDTNATINVIIGVGGARTLNGKITNNGSLKIGYELSSTSSSFINNAVGTVSGLYNLTLTGTRFLNNGTITPGPITGVLGISGDAKNSATAIYNMQIGGLTPGTQHDQYNVTGADTLNGALNVSLINGYVPTLGDSFIVCNYGTRVGTFSSVTGNIPGGYSWNIFYRNNYAVIRAGNPSNLTIVASAGPNGSISPSGNVSVVYNANQIFTITPNSNYVIDSVIVDGAYAGKQSTYTFTNVTANHTIVAKFSIPGYTITASKTGNGTITPSGAVNVNNGGSQTFNFAPANTCSAIDSIIVDGSFIGTPASYTFNNVTANHTIKAVFRTGVSMTSGSGTFSFCAGDSLTLSAAAGFNAYLWSNGKSTQSIIVKTGGTYTVTVTGTGGCQTSTQRAVTVNPLPTVTFTNPYAATANKVCFTDAGVVLNSYGTPAGGGFTGTGVYYNGFGTYSFVPSTTYGARTLVYTYTNTNGCTKTASTVITVDSNTIVNAGGDQIKCGGSNAVQLAATKGGKSTATTWSTSGTGTFNNVNALNAIYTLSSADINAGSVTLTITTADPVGTCGPVNDNMVITIYQNAVANAGSNVPVCVPNVVGLNGSITGYPLATPLWSSTGSGTFANATALNTTYTASTADINAGKVFLILRPIDPNGQCSFTGDTLEVWFDKYTVTAGANVVACGTTTVAITASKSTAVTSTVWTTNGTGTFGNANALNTNYTLSNADKALGGVTLTITTNDPTGPCGAKSSSLFATYKAATADAGPAIVCGDSIWQLNGTYSAVPGTFCNASWSSLGTGTFNNANIFNPVYTASTADKTAGKVKLVLSLIDQAGQCSNFIKDTIEVWFNPHYTVNAGPDSAFICGDKVLTLNGSKQKATSTVWSTSGTGTFANANALSTTYTFSNADTAANIITLYLTSNDPTGPCFVVVDSMKVVIKDVPKATAGTNSPVCITANLNLTASGGSTYVWSGPNAYSSTLQNIVRGNASLQMAGTYTVTVTNNVGCSKTATTVASIINCNCIPAIVQTGKTNVSCFGGTNGTATTTITNVAGPFTYLWSNGQTTANASGLVAGTYTVTVTTTPNCTGTASVTITQPPVIALAAIVTSATCGNANGSIQMQTVGGTPPYSFSWNTVPIQTTSVISSLLPGNFTCIVTDANGCTKSKAGIVVNVGNPITAAGVSVKRPCYQINNGKVTVNSVTGGLAPYKYLWSNGTTLNSISNLAPGIYTVTITDSLGCSYVVAKTVTQRSQINANIAITNPGCGLCNGIAAATVTGGLKPYTYSWNTTPVQTDSAAVNLCAGVYTLTVKDSAKCTRTFTVTLASAGPVITLLSQTNVLCNGGANGAINMNNPTGGTAPYTYTWSNGKTTKNVTGLAAGTYTLTVTSANGCTGTFSTTITQPAKLAVSISVKSAISLSADQSGGVSPYTFLWSTGTTNKVAGNLLSGQTYTVTVTDANGCTVTGSKVMPAPREIESFENDGSTIFGLFPNPASNNFTIEFYNAADQKAGLEMKDAYGKNVLTRVFYISENNQSANVDVSHLAPGIYQVWLRYDDINICKKIIITK